MYGDAVRTGIGDCVDVAARLSYHHMDIEEAVVILTYRLDHRHAEGNIRHKIAIHHIEMQVLRARLLEYTEVVTQGSEISG